MGTEQNQHEGDELPQAAEDHGLTAGVESENVTVPEGAGVPVEPIVTPSAESADGLPHIDEEFEITPSPSKGSAPPLQEETLPPDPEMVAKFITDERLDGLWVRADSAKIEVDKKVHTLDIARALLDQIMYARNYLLAGRQFFEEAERHINEVEFRVFQNFQSRKWSNAYGVPILIFELLCAVGLVLLFFNMDSSPFQGFSDDIRGMLAAMVWGGLGGVAGAWLALIKHTSQKQDFDRQHTLWYINSPFMGAVLGAFIYWVMRAGLISLTAGEVKTIDSPYVIYILAWLAGYQHNVFTAIVKRILKIMEVGTEDKAETKPKEPTPEEPKPLSVESSTGEQGSEEGPDKRG